MSCARYLIQSRTTGAFMVPDHSGQPCWEMDLKKAGAGLLSDIENCFQIIEDHIDFDDQPQVIDIVRLLTDPDY